MGFRARTAACKRASMGAVLVVVLSVMGQASGAQVEPSFQQVILDDAYIAYERDVGDLDGDGHNDVAAVMEGDTTVQVFHAPAWKRSTLIAFAGEHRYPRADDFKLADMDGDGDPDVVTRLGKGPTDDGAGIAVWCENSGGGSPFVQHLIGASLEYVKDIVVADFDRDGRLDVAMRMDSRTQLWLQEPGGTWTEVHLTYPAHEGMEAGDLDMDGDPDLVFNGYWFETPNSPSAARTASSYVQHIIDAGWFNQTGDWTKDSCKVVVADFDGDGRNDVAFSHSERPGHAVAWYGSATPRVDGAWSKHAVAVVDYCHTLQAADFDLDGDVDLLVGGMIQSQHRGLRLMLNRDRGTKWTESIIQTEGSYSAELGDIDNDGDPDIVGIRNWNSAPTWIYRNDSAQRGTTKQAAPQAFFQGPLRVHPTNPRYSPADQDAMRKAMGRTLAVANRVDLAAMTPRNDLASTGYGLANPGREYLVYLPRGGEVTVDLAAASGPFLAEWLHPYENVVRDAGTVPGGAPRSFQAPDKNDWVLHLRPQARKERQ